KYFPGIKIAEESEWKNNIQGSTGVVNLAEMPISTRWSSEVIALFIEFWLLRDNRHLPNAHLNSADKNRNQASRIRVTSKVVELINSAPEDIQPKVFVSATTVGYYGTSETQVFDEQSPSENDYLAEVCQEWESTALKVNGDVRVALIRIGVVLGKDGGALAKMIPLFKMFAGGPISSGKQWFSWIHLDDIVNLIYEALINPSYEGELLTLISPKRNLLKF
ncbi:hypothetical protein S83_051849, partial [Arachis hypogaea]